MAWGYFVASGTGNLAHTPGIMDITIYQIILQEVALTCQKITASEAMDNGNSNNTMFIMSHKA